MDYYQNVNLALDLTTAWSNIRDDILGALDKGLLRLLLFLDFTKAFDTIEYN